MARRCHLSNISISWRSKFRGAVAAATWFESLAVASHPLQQRRAETIFGSGGNHIR